MSRASQEALIRRRAVLFVAKTNAGWGNYKLPTLPILTAEPTSGDA